MGTSTDTDGTTDGSGTNTTAPNPSGTGNGNYGQLLVHGGVDAALGNNGCVYPTDVATLFNQYNAAGVSWKAYAQDLGGAQPVGSATYVTGATPGISDTVPGIDDRQSRHEPDEPRRAERRRDELHRGPAGQRQ